MAQRLSRRAFLEVGVTSLAVAAVPTRVRAQAGAIRLGTLTPLTGSGGNYGPSMLKAMQWVAGEINAAGGVLGRKLELVSEDDQTNPEAGVRAARKLIDLDKVAAIMGTWASAVTTAVAPLCWESKTFLTTVSGSDTITLLPHQGYLVRTQPNTQLQGRKFAEFMVAQGSKRVGILAVQAPFALPTQKIVGEELRKHGAELVAAVVYDKDKTTFRSEIDQVLKARPDMLYLNGYTPDVTIVLKDLYKAGYTGAKIAQAYAVNQKLAIAHAKGESTGTAIRDHVRKISQGSGARVESAVEGLKRLAQGKEINFDGASGPCDFNEIGDILDTKFRYEQAEKGKFKLLKIA